MHIITKHYQTLFASSHVKNLRRNATSVIICSPIALFEACMHLLSRHSYDIVILQVLTCPLLRALSFQSKRLCREEGYYVDITV